MWDTVDMIVLVWRNTWIIFQLYHEQFHVKTDLNVFYHALVCIYIILYSLLQLNSITFYMVSMCVFVC